jgi:alpha-1,6-mannosyltransferase
MSLWAGMENYPGGSALRQLDGLPILPLCSHPLSPFSRWKLTYVKPAPVYVHICNLAAQTGASLFSQSNSPPFLSALPPSVLADPWTYSKTENLTSIDLTRGPYTHLIVEAPLDPALKKSWKVIDVVDGFAGWHIDKMLVSMIRHVDLAGIVEHGKKGELIGMRKDQKLIVLKRK